MTHQISAYSLRTLLCQNVRGIRVVGYTVKPGYSNGLTITDKKPRGVYVGFKNNA